MAWSWGGAGGGAVAGFATGSMIGGPIGAGVGTMVGAIGGGLFGGGKKKQYDPLAGIRSQLESLAKQAPEIAARGKKFTREYADKLKTEGLQQIGENIYAERGFGRTSLENELQRKLYSDVTDVVTQSDLNWDKWALGEQRSALTQAMGVPVMEEGDTWGDQLLDVGSSMLGQHLGQLGKKEQVQDKPAGEGFKSSFEKTPSGYMSSGSGSRPLVDDFMKYYYANK